MCIRDRSKKGKTSCGAGWAPKFCSSSTGNPKVKLLPPGLKPLVKEAYVMVSEFTSYSKAILPVVFSRSSSIKYDCNPKKFVTSLEKVSSVYLKPAIILKLS